MYLLATLQMLWETFQKARQNSGNYRRGLWQLGSLGTKTPRVTGRPPLYGSSPGFITPLDITSLQEWRYVRVPV